MAGCKWRGCPSVSLGGHFGEDVEQPEHHAEEMADQSPPTEPSGVAVDEFPANAEDQFGPISSSLIVDTGLVELFVSRSKVLL